MKKHHFDGIDRISVFQFLIHFVTESEKLNISEGQAYSSLLAYLIGVSKSHFTSMQNVRCVGNIPCWPKAIQFFLRTYPIANVIRDAVATLKTPSAIG